MITPDYRNNENYAQLIFIQLTGYFIGLLFLSFIDYFVGYERSSVAVKWNPLNTDNFLQRLFYRTIIKKYILHCYLGNIFPLTSKCYVVV